MLVFSGIMLNKYTGTDHRRDIAVITMRTSSQVDGKNLALPAWLMVTLVAMCLSGCDSDPAVTPDQALTELEAVVQPKAAAPTDTFRPGPHGARDPHAALTPDKHAQVALQHLAEGRLALAMDTLTQAIERYPEAHQLYGIRGNLLLEQDNVTAALADLETAIRLAPDNPVYLTNRAQVYRKFRRDEEAMADLNRAIELDGDLVFARFNRGALSFSQGDYETALEDFDRCIAIDPHTAAPWFNRAAVNEAMGKREQAVADLKRFLQIAPTEDWKNTARDLLQQWESMAEANTSWPQALSTSGW